jgi:hypothetical protein
VLWAQVLIVLCWLAVVGYWCRPASRTEKGPQQGSLELEFLVVAGPASIGTLSVWWYMFSADLPGAYQLFRVFEF